MIIITCKINNKFFKLIPWKKKRFHILKIKEIIILSNHHNFCLKNNINFRIEIILFKKKTVKVEIVSEQ